MKFARTASLGIAAAAAALAMTTTAQAQFEQIGVNFSGGAGDEADPDQIVPVTGTTGLVPQANWNNAQGATGTLNGLIDSTNAATTANLTYASSNTWGRDLPASPTNDLLSNYLDAGTGTPATVTVANVPYAVYDVILYVRRNETADPGDMTPADGPGKFSDYTVQGVNVDVLTGDIRDNFVEATPTVIGNYVRFSGVTGATLTIQANTDAANSFRAPVDGFQIVEVPEPASLSVLGFALLAPVTLLARRPRRKA